MAHNGRRLSEKRGFGWRCEAPKPDTHRLLYKRARKGEARARSIRRVVRISLMAVCLFL